MTLVALPENRNKQTKKALKKFILTLSFSKSYF